MPVARSRSISAQSSGPEHAMIRPVALSTQRKAGMSWFEPSRMPAWLAPVCDERSGSHSRQLVAPLGHPARHVRRVAVAHRPPQHRQREPVDLEEDDARRVRARGAALSLRDPADDLQRVRVVVVRSEDDGEHDAHGRSTSAASNAQPKSSTEIASGLISAASWSISASRTSTSTNPSRAMNGSRSAATIGGKTAFRIAMSSAATRRPAEALDRDAGDDRGGNEQSRSADEPRDDQANRVEPRPLGLPRHLLAVRSACHRARPYTTLPYAFPMPQVTYVGHATVVIDLDGVRLITDPVLRPRVLHLRRVGSVPAAALRGLDAVLLSHPHWDHLDVPSLERLGKELPIVCPKGVAGLLRRKRFTHVTTLDVGEEVTIGALVGASGPCRARRKPWPAGSIGRARLRDRRVEVGVLRGRHRPVRDLGSLGPSTSPSFPSRAGARRSAPAISIPSERPRPCGGCSRGSRSRSTGAPWRLRP